MKNKESMKNCHRSEKSKETYWLNVSWFPGREKLVKKKKSRKTSEIQRKSGLVS